MKVAGTAIAEGTKSASIFIYNTTKQAAQNIAEKGKEFGELPAVQRITAKTKEGLAKAANVCLNYLFYNKKQKNNNNKSNNNFFIIDIDRLALIRLEQGRRQN